MEERVITQIGQIKEHLLAGNSLTPIEALNMFGAFRLSAVVFKLKEQGLNIKTDIISEDNKRFAKYSIIN